jgi:hypothetical protein
VQRIRADYRPLTPEAAGLFDVGDDPAALARSDLTGSRDAG